MSAEKEGSTAAEKSGEEVDQLARSTKKAKMVEESESLPCAVVAESPLENAQVGSTPSEFMTATEIAMKRKVISYADICIGVNGAGKGGDTSDEEGFLEDLMEEEASEEEEGEEKEKGEHEEDHLCPVVKISKEEIKEAQQYWRKALIVKLLGKRVGLRYMQTRLTKMWQTVGTMDVIDLEL